MRRGRRRRAAETSDLRVPDERERRRGGERRRRPQHGPRSPPRRMRRQRVETLPRAVGEIGRELERSHAVDERPQPAELLELAPTREARAEVRLDARAVGVAELAVEVRNQFRREVVAGGDHRNSSSSRRNVAVARNTRLFTALSEHASASATSRYESPSTRLSTNAAR